MHQQKQSLERLTRWGQLGIPSSHWTTVTADRALLIGFGLVTLFHWILSGFLPPAEDELYYWAWSRTLAWGYYDHPPMVAWLIRASTGVFGNGLFGLRFFASLLALGTLLLLRAMSTGPHVLLFALGTPVFLLGAVLMTPDVPFLFFWTVYVFWLTRVNQTFAGWSDDPVSRVYHETPISPFRWCIGGLILGLGLLSKYTMLLAVPCGILFFKRYRIRAWWKGYLFHLAIAGLMFVPVLYFNSQHHFASFRYQFEHGFTEEGPSLFRLFEFFGIQSILVGALPFLMFPWVLLKFRDLSQRPSTAACFYFFVPTLCFFLIKTFFSYIEANWPLVAFISFFPLAEGMMNQSSFRYASRWLLIGAFLPALVTSALVLIHLLSPLSVIPPQKDRITRMKAFLQLGTSIVADIRDNGRPEKVFTPTYQLTALLRFKGASAEQMNVGRASQFTLHFPDPCQQDQVLVLANTNESHEILKCFSHSEVLREYPLMVRDFAVAHYTLTHYSK